MSNAVNLLLYYLGWFACVLGAAGSRSHVGAAIALGLVALHLGWASPWSLRRTLFIVVAGALGTLLETGHGALGAVRYPDPLFGVLCPLWISVSWMGFATLFQGAMAWLVGRYGLASILGAMGAPLAYAGGERLGAVELHEERTWALLMIGLGWAVAMPILAGLARGMSPGPLRYRGLKG